MPSDAKPQPSQEEIERRIVDYIRKEFVGHDVVIDRHTELLSQGMLDSVAVLRLATFVDEEFQIGMKPTDFVIENFISVAALADYVQRSRSSKDESPPGQG